MPTSGPPKEAWRNLLSACFGTCLHTISRLARRSPQNRVPARAVPGAMRAADVSYAKPKAVIKLACAGLARAFLSRRASFSPVFHPSFFPVRQVPCAGALQFFKILPELRCALKALKR